MRPRQWGAAVFALVLTAALVPAGQAVEKSWRIGQDTSVETCLPYRVYLIRLGIPDPHRGDLVAFHAKGMEPFFADGEVFTKMVLGVPGDHVSVTAKGVQVAGKFLPFREQALQKLGPARAPAVRQYRLAADEFFMAGTNPRAYDSRYYGPVKSYQFVGTSKALW